MRIIFIIIIIKRKECIRHRVSTWSTITFHQRLKIGNFDAVTITWDDRVCCGSREKDVDDNDDEEV
jgi:hypothetical protein